MTTAASFIKNSDNNKNQTRANYDFSQHQININKGDLATVYNTSDEIETQGFPFCINGVFYNEEGSYGPFWTLYLTVDNADVIQTPKQEGTKYYTLQHGNKRLLCKVYIDASNDSRNDTLEAIMSGGEYPVHFFSLEKISFNVKSKPANGKGKAKPTGKVRTFYRFAVDHSHETCACGGSTSAEMQSEENDLDDKPF